MTVKELIEELGHVPEGMEVQIWDHQVDDYVPVVQVLYESGCPYITLLTVVEETYPATEGD